MKLKIPSYGTNIYVSYSKRSEKVVKLGECSNFPEPLLNQRLKKTYLANKEKLTT